MYNVRELTHDEMCDQVRLLGDHIVDTIQGMSGIELRLGTAEISAERTTAYSALTVFTSFSGIVQGEYFFSVVEENVPILLGLDDVSFDFEDLMDGYFEELLNVSVGQTIEELKDTYAYLAFAAPRIAVGNLIFPEYLSARVPLYDIENKLFGECKFSINMAKIEITDKLLDTMKKLRKSTEVSNIDQLTGLYNRTYFEYYVTKLFGKKMPLTLAILDIDLFKNINDGYGHAVGDEALKYVAAVLKKNARDSDIIVRYGGDEVVVFFENTEPFGAKAYFNRVAKFLKEEPLITESGDFVVITLSIGIGEHIKGTAFQELFERVDSALYKAKESGRDQICVC